MDETDDKANSLIESLDKLESQISKLASLKHRFISGIVVGFGTVIGATIIVAIAAYALSLFAKFGIFPVITEWIAKTIG